MDKVKCEAFLIAAEQGSLSAAAKSLGYTQPGITRMINTLEEEVGFPLLIRTKRGVALTPNGQKLVPLFRDIVQAQRLLAETTSAIRGVLTGSLTIGCYYSVSAMLLPNILKSFLADYPNITIYLKEGTNAELTKWLQEGVIDISFSAKPSMKEEFDWIPVLNDELMVWLPNRYAPKYKESFPIKELEKYPFIITQPDNDTDIDRVLHDLGIEADIHFSTKDAYATYKMVEADLGVSFNQQLIARDWSGKVTVLPFKPAQYIELGLALPSMIEASPVTKKFIKYVKNLI